MSRILLFDFDSTWTRVEALDVLADQLALAGRISHDAAREIANLTELGMAGHIGFGESLRRRLMALDMRERDLTGLIHYLQGQITPSILENRDWVTDNAHRIWIVSNGFREFIAPVVSPFGIPESQILANTFEFAADGRVKGASPQTPLATDGGKPIVVADQQFGDAVWAIGDGISDYQIRSQGAASAFVAFTENIRRPHIVELADFEAPNLQTLIDLDSQQ